MYLVDFEGCCSAKILTGFGQEGTAEYDYRPAKSNYSVMELELRKKIQKAQEEGNALVCLTHTQNQTRIAKLIVKYGFLISSPMSKAQHRENTLTLAYLPLLGYQMPPLGDKVVIEARPRDAKGRFIKSNPFKGKN